MTKSELARVVSLHIENSLSVGELTSDQSDALDYYYGRPYGNETAGQSQVVTREVLEAVEWAMPSLMRVFSSEQAVEFDPVGEEDVEQASQETDAIRHVVWKYSDGFSNVYKWSKDGLLQRVGYAKVYIEEEEETVVQTHEGVTAEAASMLDLENATDAIEVLTENGPTYNITIETTTIRKKPKWMVIEPENVRVSKRIDDVCVDDADFVAHVEQYTQSDLIEMGIPKKTVESLPSYNIHEEDTDSVETARASHSGEQNEDEIWAEQSMRPIQVWECYVRADNNGDGVAELLKVLYAGKTVLRSEEVDDIPIVAWSPIPMPHQHAGLGLADLVMDLQKIKSTLTRQVLDNLYLTNNPEKEVVWDNVLVQDDLMQSVPGGIKRVSAAGTITPLTVPFSAQHSMPMLEYLNGVQEGRTGISRHTMGLDADALAQSTKGAYLGALEQANQRLELIARLFAENGLRKLYLKLHALMVENMDEELRVNLSGDFVSINPSQWARRQDMTVTVGTGNSSIEKRALAAQQVMEIQEKIISGGGYGRLVTEQNIYNAASDFVGAVGKSAESRYFTNPANLDPPKPKEDPTQQLMMMQAQIEQMKEQNKAQSDQMKNQIEQQKIELDRQRLHLEYREQTRKEVETEADIATDVVGMGAQMEYPQQVVPE